MAEFPDIYTSDFSKDNFKLAKEAIDFAVLQYNSTSQLRKAIQKIYDSYNGIINPKDHESLTKPYGIQSRNEYTHYNNGINKIKTLVGEYLSTDIDPRVETIDETQINAKYQKYLQRQGMLEMKDQIQTGRDMGYNVMPGMLEQMENDKQFLNPENFKTENERILTKYLKQKLVSDNLKSKFKQNLIDVLNSCIIAGKVDTINGLDTYRRISPLNCMYMDSDSDGTQESSPYVGEKRTLYYHQIIKEFNIGKDEKEVKDKLKELSGLGNVTDLNSENNNTVFKGNQISVYTIEFKTIANESFFRKSPDPTAIIREIPAEEYNRRKKKYDREELEGQYKIIRVIHEEVWEITRIGADLYRNIRKTVRQANALENKKMRACYNYIISVVDTVEGQRIPLQFIIAKLDKAYNDVMFLINRELRKPSGSALGINVGFLTKEAGYKQSMTELTDDGVIRYNTAAEGNQSNTDGRNEHAMNGVNIGNKSQVIDTLLRLKSDIENSTDRISGISRGRAGMEMATTTATTSNNNLETSRTNTYDIIYYVKDHVDEVLTRMVDKAKLNFVENNPDMFGGIYSKEEFMFLNATSDIVLDQFSAYINDGRKELNIRQKIEPLFQVDINNGTLRTKDVIRYHLKDTLAEGLKVLDNAWEEISKQKEAQEQSAQENQLKAKEMDAEMMKENREDLQAHDIDKITRTFEANKELKILENELELGIEHTNNYSKERMHSDKLASKERETQVKSQQANNKNLKK